MAKDVSIFAWFYRYLPDTTSFVVFSLYFRMTTQTTVLFIFRLLKQMKQGKGEKDERNVNAFTEMCVICFYVWFSVLNTG